VGEHDERAPRSERLLITVVLAFGVCCISAEAFFIGSARVDPFVLNIAMFVAVIPLVVALVGSLILVLRRSWHAYITLTIALIALPFVWP
jgi:hypothetical protein